MNSQYVGRSRDEADRNEVTHGVPCDIGVETWVDDDAAGHNGKGVAVRGRLGSSRGPDVAGTRWNIFDVGLLAPGLGKRLRNYARNDVGRATGCKRHDHAHRAGWIGLRPRNLRAERAQNRSSCKLKELTAYGRHGVPPRLLDGRDDDSSAL